MGDDRESIKMAPENCPGGFLQNGIQEPQKTQRKTPETVVVSGVLQVSGIDSALAELPEPDRDDVDFGRFSSFYARKTAYFSAF